MRRSFFETDFKRLDGQIKHYRNLYGVYAGQNANGLLSREDIFIILQATGLEAKYNDRVMEALNWKGKTVVEFLDFISYIPFFARIHASIIENVMKSHMNIEDLLKSMTESLKSGPKNE